MRSLCYEISVLQFAGFCLEAQTKFHHNRSKGCIRKSTSSGENGVSVLRKMDRNPRARPRFTSGIPQAALNALRSRDVRYLRPEFLTFALPEYGLQNVHRFLKGGARGSDQLLLEDSFAGRKIHGKYPEFPRSCIRVAQRLRHQRI